MTARSPLKPLVGRRVAAPDPTHEGNGFRTPAFQSEAHCRAAIGRGAIRICARANKKLGKFEVAMPDGEHERCETQLLSHHALSIRKIVAILSVWVCSLTEKLLHPDDVAVACCCNQWWREALRKSCSSRACVSAMTRAGHGSRHGARQEEAFHSSSNGSAVHPHEPRRDEV